MTIEVSPPSSRSTSDARSTTETDSVTGRSLFVSMAGLVIVGVVVGAAMADFDLAPYRKILAPAFAATRELRQQKATAENLQLTNLWYPSRYAQRGVVTHLPDKSFSGYTLYSSGHLAQAQLIDMDGNVKHQWRIPFNEVWAHPTHVPRRVDDRFVHWRRTHLFPNGDLIAVYEAYGETPYGYGMVKLDAASNLIWKFSDNTHHDFCVDQDGTILALTHKFRDTRKQPIPKASHLADSVLEDFVVRLSPDGEEVKRVSLVDAFANSDFGHLLRTVSRDEWDILHANSVGVVTPEFAQHHGFAEAGQVMVSLRSPQALALLDMDQEQIVWAQMGPYRYQHDPDLLANGRVLLFDNQGNTGAFGPSRVVELNPQTNAVTWEYGGGAENFFYSPVRSCQQLLANGNVLITESSGGRIFEVTRDGQVVWEYRNPEHLDGDERFIPIICGAMRFSPSQLHFELKRP